VAECKHIAQVEKVNRGGNSCVECEKLGDTWIHLRTCQDCGVTLCCDSSKNKHATAHFKSHGHPVVASAEKGEYWMWCYEDEAFFKYA
jgi:uncharacterized UBP type Zn finger protein